MTFKSKQSKANAKNAKGERKRKAASPKTDRNEPDSSQIDESNIIEEPRRKRPNIGAPEKAEQNFIMSSLEFDSVLDRYACIFCGKFGHCISKPTQWSGVVLHYTITCQVETGGCGQSERRRANDRSINTRIAVAMKISGIRKMQLQRYQKKAFHYK